MSSSALLEPKQSSAFTSRIFWPEQLKKCTVRHFIVGYNLESFKCCVTNAFPQNRFSFDELQLALRKLSDDMPPWLARCSSNGKAVPCILGEWVPRADGSFSPHYESRHAGIWLVVCNGTGALRMPSLHLLFSCGCMHRTSCIFIQYSADTLHFTSLTGDSSVDMKFTLHQIAAARYIEHHLHCQGIPSTAINTRTQALHRIYSIIVYILLVFSRLHYAVSHWSLAQLETPLLLRSFAMSLAQYIPRWMRSCSPRDLSLTAAQLCHRYRSSLVIYGMMSSSDVSETPAVTLHLFLTLSSRCLFMCIDTTLGAICGGYLWIHKHEVIEALHRVCAFVEDSVLRSSFDWFRSNPYGVKLNAELATRLAAFLLKLLESIKIVYTCLLPIEMPLLLCICCMGCLGLTYQLLFAADVVRLLCLPIAIIHRLLSALHKLQISALYTLSLLFQGRKQNILRQRVDTCSASHQQLVTSTIIFAGIIFLLPTFAAYYTLFLSLQICIVMLLGTLWGMSVAMKELPLFLFICRMTKPNYFVSGINYLLMSPTEKNCTTQSSMSSSRAIVRRLLPRREVTAASVSVQPDFDDCFSSDSRSNSGDDGSDDEDLLGLDIISDDSSYRKSSDRATAGSSSEDNSSSKAIIGGSVIAFKKKLVYSEENRLMAAKAKMRRLAQEMQQQTNPSASGGVVSPPGQHPKIKSQIAKKQSGNNRSSQQVQISATSTNMIYVRLIPRYSSLLSPFNCFRPYVTYFVTPKFASRVFRGIFIGRPAIDLQIIRASIDIFSINNSFSNYSYANGSWESFHATARTMVRSLSNDRNASRSEHENLRYISIGLLLVSDFLCVLICSAAAIVFLTVFLQHSSKGWSRGILWHTVTESNGSSHALLPMHLQSTLLQQVM